MTRLPNPGQDEGTWGAILNEFLTASHNTDGSLRAGTVNTAAIVDGTVTEQKLSSAVQTKLNVIAPVTSVNGSTGAVTLAKSDIGLGNVDNTSDVNKPVSSLTQTALDLKADDASVVHVSGNENVSGVKTFLSSPIVPTPSAGTEAANKTYVDGVAGAGAPDATSSVKGIVQLAGDLGGTAASPTVPGLAGKANTSHSHAATDVASGVLDIARLPTGTTSSTVSLGDHAHTGVYLPIKSGISSLTDSTNDRFARVDIADDASPTAGWPDRFAFYFNSTRTGYHNEYGELRARPAKSNTVALRAMYFGSGTANIFEVAPSAAGTEYFAVSSTAASLSVPLTSTQNITTTGTVAGSNIGAKVTASATAPVSPATGDVWIDLSA
jgi:hypothetical protein